MQKIAELEEWFQLYKEYDDIFHDLSLKMKISDSAFIIFYGICALGNGCLQKDICANYFISKQTVNSSTRRLEQDGYIYLKNGNGRDMHLYLTPKGAQFAEKNIYPVIRMEEEAFLEMAPHERNEMVRLTRKYVALMKEKAEHFFE